MTEPTKRDPRTDPWHPHSKGNHHAVADAIRGKHSTRAALAQQALTGGKLNAQQQRDAADFLAAVQSVLANNGPVNVAFGYLLEAADAAITVQRAQSAKAKAAA